ELAFHHLLGEIDQLVENPEISLLDGNLERLHVEPIAGKDALGVSPLSVGCGTATARGGFVNDVVMDQRGRVNDFYHASQSHGAAVVMGKELGREQKQSGANPLAAAGAEVFADFGDRAHAGDRAAAELALDGGEIIAQELKDFFGAVGRCWVHNSL